MDLQKAEYYYNKFKEAQIGDEVIVMCENGNGSGTRSHVKRIGTLTEIKFHDDFDNGKGSIAKGQITFTLFSKNRYYELRFVVEDIWKYLDYSSRTFIGSGSYILNNLGQKCKNI